MYLYGSIVPSLVRRDPRDRWTPLIVRECSPASSASMISTRTPGISRALLVERLRGWSERDRGAPPGAERLTAYHLTRPDESYSGSSTCSRLGARWAFGDPKPRELDPSCFCGGCGAAFTASPACATRRIEFDFRGCRPRGHWLVLERGDVSCA